MILAKALKKKNRIAQKISNLQQIIQRENSLRSDDPRKIKVESLYTELDQKVEDIIKLKIAIFIASTPMRENILRLSELKSKIVFLQGINTTEGKVSNFREEPTEYTAAYDKLFVRDQVGLCEEKIDEIQDELDKFNHTTEVEI
jgi:vacuolar-type H+-ATPase subunit I/STV1